MFSSQFQKKGEIAVFVCKVEDSFGYLVVVPHYVNAQGIHAHCFDHNNSVLPILVREAAVLHFSRVDRQKRAQRAGILRLIFHCLKREN